MVRGPHADATALGTRFTFTATETATRLEVREGTVRMTRRSDGKNVTVRSWHYAQVGGKLSFRARRLPVDEIFILGSSGRIVKDEWEFVGDEDTASGSAVQVSKPLYRYLQRMDAGWPCVEFTLEASAGTTYHVWVRGKCLEETEGKLERDYVRLIIPGAKVVGGGTSARAKRLAYSILGSSTLDINGFACKEGYFWIGGDYHGLGREMYKDAVPLQVRFAQDGKQTLRLYAVEAPVRIDAIWLSTTQKERPEKDAPGPWLPVRKK
jgi:hypothetical protein